MKIGNFWLQVDRISAFQEFYILPALHINWVDNYSYSQQSERRVNVFFNLSFMWWSWRAGVFYNAIGLDELE